MSHYVEYLRGVIKLFGHFVGCCEQRWERWKASVNRLGPNLDMADQGETEFPKMSESG